VRLETRGGAGRRAGWMGARTTAEAGGGVQEANEENRQHGESAHARSQLRQLIGWLLGCRQSGVVTCVCGRVPAQTTVCVGERGCWRESLCVRLAVAPEMCRFVLCGLARA